MEGSQKEHPARKNAVDQILVPDVRSDGLSGGGLQGPSVLWQLKAAANLSLFGRPNTNKGIFGVISL